jgi:predicted amidohydrolase YtcJ
MLYADLAIVNGNVITCVDTRPRVEALAVRDGKFVAAGATTQIKELVGRDTSVMDLKGRTVTPGFIDAHCHPSIVAKNQLQVDCTPGQVATIDDMVDVLANRAKATPKGKWIRGYGYDDTKLREQRHPTLRELDRASREHPIFVEHVSVHAGVANSRALEAAGVSRESPDPASGSFERDANGELTGVCRESAYFMFWDVIPYPNREELREPIRLMCRKYHSTGITSVGDAWVDAAELKLYQDALEDGLLSLRVYMMMLSDRNLASLKALKLRTGFGDRRLRLGPVKMFVDGSISARTAYMYEPYVGRPDDYGMVTLTQEELDRKVLEAHEAGFQIAVHANGDRAIDMLLDAYEKALNRLPRENHRHRIEHCTVVNPRILKRIKELGLVVFPFATYVYEHGEKMKNYGARISMMFAYRSFLDYGIAVAGSTDNPCGPVDPLIAFQSMATRTSKDGEVLGPEQKISVEEAIRIYTLGSAYASFEEDVKGSIEAGKLADFVVLSDDPTGVSPDRIKDIKVEKTFVGGEVVYASGDA